ncbi:Hypothetical protein CAP_2044 [Chondromyces apiculatus DSM 436]|uniref:Uncharacterized protein n=1 Tax=Chondromyces apiculatus DSM 436 TaxID=1192034 RepID=A0A017TB98_9BACT|nr:Hypothetical protein CAP_2044 [Chondromyces apiculatus DSM 436]
MVADVVGAPGAVDVVGALWASALPLTVNAATTTVARARIPVRCISPL